VRIGSVRTSSGRARLAARGKVVVRLRSGEDPPHVHAWHDVALGAAVPATRLDGGAVDGALRRFSPAMRVSRAFCAAAHVNRPGHGHHGWDDLEESIGLSRTFGIELDPEVDLDALVAELAALATVELASPEFLCTTPFGSARNAARDPRWAHRMIGAAEALEIEGGDPATLVGIVDSGVFLEHPELVGHLRAGANAVSLCGGDMPDGMKLVDETPRDRRPEDRQGHGTGCAGIIGANGYQIPPGVAGACWMIPVKALCAAHSDEHDEPTAIGSLLDIDRAVKTCVDLGARVLNLSFGTPESALSPHDPVPHVEVVRYALGRDCVLCAASGNSGGEAVFFPAALPGVIAVGSVDEERRPSRFSSRGDHVSLCAPGEAIPLAGLDGYTEGYGTSFAAPFVAAACTLMVARGLRHGVPLAASTVRNLLAASVGPFAAGADRRGCGAGILDVPAALRAVDQACLQPPDELGDPEVSSESNAAYRGGGP
jgi:subtilisin family serine protease